MTAAVCPFCGSFDITFAVIKPSHGTCEGCGAQGPIAPMPTEAIMSWNRRAALPPPERADALFAALAHGDDEHRRWLREALEAYFAGEPMPPVRSKSKDDLESRIADLEAQKKGLESMLCDAQAEVARMRDALTAVVKIVRDFYDFHDSKTKPCGEYGVECPIGMGEWIERSDRAALASAEAALRSLPPKE